MRIQLQDGTEIPFNTVAEVQYGRGYAIIRRVDKRRVANVTADVDKTIANTAGLSFSIVFLKLTRRA